MAAMRSSSKEVSVAKNSPLDLGELVVSHLSTKAFCTVDAGLSNAVLLQALQEGMDLGQQGGLRRPPTIIVDGLLGNEGSAEIAELELGEDGAAPASVGEGLSAVDRAMSNVAASCAPFIPMLGFESSMRTPAVLHVSKTPDSEPSPLGEEEASNWLFQFMRGAIMCVIAIGPDTGTFVLDPYDEEAEAFEIQTTPGTMVVLRTDALSVSHSCPGAGFLISCFVLDNRPLDDKRNIDVPMTPVVQKLTDWVSMRLDELKTTEVDERKPDVPRHWLVVMNRHCFKGQHMAARGVSTRFPVTWTPEIWFAASVSGVDYMEEVPLIRWDHARHYDPDPEMWRAYKTYAKHLGVMDGSELFDNKMFTITPAESKVMDPQQRMVLECGYEALFAAGLKKGRIMNSLGGMYLGYGTGTSDFTYVERTTDSGAEGSFGATGGSAAITANRFSFCLGMKGPSIAIDSEDASGLVAVHLGCEALQKKGRGQVNDFSLVGGIKLNLAAFYWPQKQAAGLLSRVGRCLSFDASADGFIMGDAACNVCVRQLTEVVDGQILLKEGESLAGVIASSSVNSNGRSASLSAPNGPAQQEVISMSVRAAMLSGFDVDGAESYGAGGFMYDAVEISSWTRILRTAEDCIEPLGFTCIKTNTGNMQHASTSALIRTLCANAWGLLTPNCHLRQMNPHMDTWQEPLFCLSELVEFRLRSSYYGSLACGFAGTNACCFTWGHVEDERLRPAPRGPERERLVFWPGGGGALEGGAQPRKGFHIAGTFTQWEPEPMEMERTGVYIYDLIMGENRWEQFQVWLDGDPKKCLHPEEAKAPRLTKVVGPEPTPEGHTWLIEGRTLPAEVDGTTVALTVPGQVGGIDRALIGAKYRIRLHIAGKYRMVDWERLTGRPEDQDEVPMVTAAAKTLTPSRYFISADWNGWGFEQMEEDSPGVYSLNVHLVRYGGEFQIVRNRDWDQVIYPYVGGRPGSEGPENVGGPDDASDGRAWFLNGRRGNTFRIEFTRTNENGFDVRRVSWTKTGDKDLTQEQKEAAQRSRYAVFGSWDAGSRLRELKWNGSYYYFFVELGSEGQEDFQLVQEFDWNRLFHPSEPEAGSGGDWEILGPSAGDGRSRGLNWTIGKGGYEKPGDRFEVQVYSQASYFGSYVRKVEWAKVPSNRSLQEAEAEGLVLRSMRR